MAEGNEVSNAEIMAELRAMRAVIDGLLSDFGPLIAAFRPQNGAARADYIGLAGAARAARRARKHERGD